MPQTCSICTHTDRLQIEASLIAGMSLRDVAGQFAVSRNAVHRHKQNCMKPAIATVQDDQRYVQAEQAGWNAITEMQWLRTEARRIYGTSSDPRIALSALAEIRKQTQLFSELLSGIEETSQEKREQEWINLREVIFEALLPYPDARLAVARALLALGEKHDRDAREQLG